MLGKNAVSRMVVWFFLFLLCQLAGAQEVIYYRNAPEGLKKVYKKGLEASRAYDFDKAMSYFQKAIRMEPSFIDAHIQAASLLYEKEEYEAAETAFEEVLTLDSTYKPKVFYSLGIIEWNQDKYEEAAQHFQSFLNIEKDNEILLKKAVLLFNNALFLAQAYKNPVPFKPERMEDAINTDMPEYLPSITADNREFYFTRVVDGQEDFYYSKFENDEWQEAKPVSEINSLQNEGAQTITADGKMMVFTACNRPDGYGSCDLYISYKRRGRWSNPVNLGSPINTGSWESQPSLSANGDALYFSSMRNGGYGGRDLWVSYKQENGHWGVPLNAGQLVNTAYDEEAPFIHPDNQTLYFMSDGHPGIGGKDLYLSRKNSDGIFGEPSNLGYPINTKAHEGALFVNLEGNTAFFATDRQLDMVGENREKQRPNTDIYQFQLHDDARPLPVTYVRADVRDKKTGRPLEALVSIYNLKEDKPLVQAMTDEDGQFLFCLPANSDYALHIIKEGYLFYSDHFALSEGKNNLHKPFLLEALLQAISDNPEIGKPVRLDNVFFEFGSAVLRAESEKELVELKKLLEVNTNLRIRINGHTDNVGDAESNQQLSEKRAKAVYDFLVDAGIPTERLDYMGFGEKNPIADNDTEAGRQLNRRTEFEVLK